LGKTQALEIAEIILRAVGPYAMTDDAQWGPLNGLLEHYQRSAVVGLHPGGTTISESHHGPAHRHWPCGEGTGWTTA